MKIGGASCDSYCCSKVPKLHIPVKVGEANGAFKALEAISDVVVLFNPVTCVCIDVA